MKAKKTVRYVLAAELLLLVPLLAMMFTDDVDWDVRDFAVAAVLLAGFGVALSLIMNKARNTKQIAIGLMFVAIIFLIWAELAVGVFGTPFAGS